MMRKVKGTQDGQVVVIPLHEEEMSVVKQQLITGRVDVSTVTHQHQQLVDELLTCESVEIERVPVGQTVMCVPEVREEGDTLIIPVVEEVLVIERRLLLKEEVRVRRVRTTRRHMERVQLRRQEARIKRQGRPTQGTLPEPDSQEEP